MGAVLLDVLFPPGCAVCGARGRSPCAGCEAALRRPPTLPPPPGVDRLVALLAYEDEGRELVARLKYRNARSSLPWLAERLAARVDPHDLDVVTWLPTTGRRRRRRGFDQSELLARAVARRLGLPCVRLLRRCAGPPQTGRTRVERRRRPPLTAVRPRTPDRVLLVDDVCTTGTSLAAGAAVLRRHGTAVVSAATVARALPRSL
jgi:predicted amidophosphoribosyltransferase